MFQRQSRKSFPSSYIFILAAAVLALLFFLIKNLNKEKPQNPAPAVEQTGEQ